MDFLFTPVYGAVTVLDLLIFAIIVVVALILARIAGTYLKRNLSDRMEKDALDSFVKFVQVVIVLVGIFIGLPRFSVNVTELVILGGAASVAIGFASQRLVTSIGSGIFLIFERPVKTGDTVKIGGTEGTIKDIRILSTTVKTYEGIYVRIPNETVFNSEITNYVANVARRFEYIVGIRYSDDADLAIRTIFQLLEDHPFVLKNPAPSVYVDELGNSSVNIMVRIWAPSREWWSVRTEMLLKIKLAIEEQGIEIPFPQRVVWFAQDGGAGAAPLSAMSRVQEDAGKKTGDDASDCAGLLPS